MALVLNEEQALLRESAADFFNHKAPLESLRKLRDEQNPAGFDRNIWSELAELGLAGINIPEAYGGLGFGYLGLGQVLEMGGRTLTASPLISSVLLGATALIQGGTEVQKKNYLAAIASGDLIMPLAYQEGSHHTENISKTTAEAHGDTYILNGRKVMVFDAHVADEIIVSASLNGEQALFIVSALAKGLTITKTQMVDSRNAGKLILENVKVAKEAKLAGGAESLKKTFDIAAIGLAAEMLGICQEAFERTVAYLKERKQFGLTIGSFQALQHRAAKMFIEVELCKSIVIKGLTAVDENTSDLASLASLAKAKLGETIKLITNEAIQMHGGIGMTDEMDFGFFIKRARVLQQTLGDYNYHLDRYAKLNGY